MRANISIKIEDDTRAEELRAHGITDQQVLTLYEQAFGQLLNYLKAENPGIEYELLVSIVDNTKEEAKT